MSLTFLIDGVSTVDILRSDPLVCPAPASYQVYERMRMMIRTVHATPMLS